MDSKKHPIEWEEYELLEHYEKIKHATILRHGGVSKAPFDTLNTSTNVGDNPEHVKVNRRIVQEFIGAKQVIYPNQAHGNQVGIVEKNQKIPSECDGLITNEKEIALAVLHADCQAAFFYDPIVQAIGIAHAGYKGLIQNIYQKMIDHMHRAFGCEIKNIHVCISASIGPEHAEYKDYQQEFPEHLWEFQKNGFFDLWQLAKYQLTEEGIKENHIEINKKSTLDNAKDYFSYRRDKVTGRNVSVIKLM